MMRAGRIAALVLFGLSAAAPAPALEVPSPARMTVETREGPLRLSVPIGPFEGEGVPTLAVEGQVLHQVWTYPQDGLTSLQILTPLREALLSEGYLIIFECADADCGGFDFRFATPTLPEPQMHVDLGDFLYLTARRTAPDGPDFLCLMVSRSSNRAFIQITRVTGAEAPEIKAEPDAMPPQGGPAKGGAGRFPTG
ncbi:OmpA domain protein [Rhodovulum sp. P5]|uniref:hypothetical protein n=1 Tax=Rhodovulum sp. P5 TaxID=1564506 RepID=UPI0009C25650|nr:hypothetical protein [Rhodovulum sp. P5]ARE40312.1 OmpA domain protein [Rhodovulum sp. P5]